MRNPHFDVAAVTLLNINALVISVDIQIVFILLTRNVNLCIVYDAQS